MLDAKQRKVHSMSPPSVQDSAILDLVRSATCTGIYFNRAIQARESRVLQLVVSTVRELRRVVKQGLVVPSSAGHRRWGGKGDGFTDPCTGQVFKALNRSVLCMHGCIPCPGLHTFFHAVIFLCMLVEVLIVLGTGYFKQLNRVCQG